MSSFGQLNAGSLSRTQVCLVGQIAGDAFGSFVELESCAYIERLYPVACDCRAGRPTARNSLLRSPGSAGQIRRETLAVVREVVRV